MEKETTNRSSIMNIDEVDFTKEPLFFGQNLGIQRYDKFRYKHLFDQFLKQLSYFWRPEEFNVQKDKSDFEQLTTAQQKIFTLNIGYQIVLDTVQSRGITNLLKWSSNPEFEAFAKTWEFFETLHSYSYTYIIKGIYSNPSLIFDGVLKDPEIIKRASSVTQYYDQLIDQFDQSAAEVGFAEKIIEASKQWPVLKDIFGWAFGKKYEEVKKLRLHNSKKALYLTLISINILEGIRFYVSFACSYCFAENKKMEGNAKIIEAINRDESLHMGFTSYIIKCLMDNPDEGFQDVVKECQPIVIQMFKDAAEEEMAWAQYIFKDGQMLGLNADILTQYMKWLTNNRMKIIKLEPIFDKVQNPINWINKWTESKSVQSAPQETEITTYVVGSLNQDLDKNALSDFEL